MVLLDIIDPNSITTLPAYLQAHWKDITDIIVYVIAIASIIVKATPTLKDDNVLLPIIKFIAKLGLNTRTPDKRPE